MDVPTLFDSTASRSSSFAQPVGEQDIGAGVGLGFGSVRIPSSFTGGRPLDWLIPPGENEGEITDCGHERLVIPVGAGRGAPGSGWGRSGRAM